MAGEQADNYSLEPLFNDLLSISDGVYRILRVTNSLDQFDGYRVSDQDVTPGDGTSYYGYLNKDGAWIIMRGIRSGNVTNYTFAKGSSGYDFSNRAAESYDIFSTTF